MDNFAYLTLPSETDLNFVEYIPVDDFFDEVRLRNYTFPHVVEYSSKITLPLALLTVQWTAEHAYNPIVGRRSLGHVCVAHPVVFGTFCAIHLSVSDAVLDAMCVHGSTWRL